jgi:hypothetical protein
MNISCRFGQASLFLCVCFFVLSCISRPVNAQGVVTFEDLVMTQGTGFNNFNLPEIADNYTALGMTMSASELIWIGNGVSQGDAGSFLIEGSNSPAYIALASGGPGGTLAFSFVTPVDLTLDLITTSVISIDVPIQVTLMRGGMILDSTLDVFGAPSPGDPDGRVHHRSYQNVDMVQFMVTDDNAHAIAFDNLQITDAPGGCSVADLNEDGSLNFLDVSAFLEIYGQGCP